MLNIVSDIQVVDNSFLNNNDIFSCITTFSPLR